MPNFVRSIHRVTEIHLAPSTGGGGWQILVSSGDDDFTVREHWVALNAGGNVALTIEDSVAEFEGIIPTPPGQRILPTAPICTSGRSAMTATTRPARRHLWSPTSRSIMGPTTRTGCACSYSRPAPSSSQGDIDMIDDTAIRELRAAAAAHRTAARRAARLIELGRTLHCPPWEVVALTARAEYLDELASKFEAEFADH